MVSNQELEVPPGTCARFLAINLLLCDKFGIKEKRTYKMLCGFFLFVFVFEFTSSCSPLSSKCCFICSGPYTSQFGELQDCSAGSQIQRIKCIRIFQGGWTSSIWNIVKYVSQELYEFNWTTTRYGRRILHRMAQLVILTLLYLIQFSLKRSLSN